MLASLERSRERERRFLADASHELRTPLTALRGNVAYLRGTELTTGGARRSRARRRAARAACGRPARALARGGRDAARRRRAARPARASARRRRDVDVVLHAPVDGAGRSRARSSARSRISCRTRARTGRRTDDRDPTVDEAGDGAAQRRRRGPRAPAEEARARLPALLAREPERPGSGLGLAIVRATAERHGGRAYAEGARFTIELPALRDLSGSGARTEGRPRERIAVKLFRALSTTRLVALIAVFAALAAGSAALAVAASGGGGPTPPAKPLAHAIHDALAGPAPDGITADITFTNKLFPSGALHRRDRLGAPDRRDRPPLGDERRPRPARAAVERRRRPDRLERRQGHRLRRVVEHRLLVHAPEAAVDRHGHSRQGHAAAALRDHDAPRPTSRSRPPSPARSPTTSANQPAYTVTVSPKHDGGLLGSAQLAFDAARGVPLRVAIYAQGSSTPALALEATNISYGAVPASDVDISPPAGAKVVDLSSAASSTIRAARRTRRTQVDRSRRSSGRRRLPASPRRTRSSGCRARTSGSSARTPRSSSTAKASARCVIVERKADPAASRTACSPALPTVALNGADGARARDAARHRARVAAGRAARSCSPARCRPQPPSPPRAS